jgi:squalene synthase HpnC
MTTIDARTSGGARTADNGRSPRPEPAAITDIAASTDEVLRSAYGENFPVSPVVLPRAIRSHFQAIYGFCRLVDDIGDEAPGDRLALLDELDADLARIWTGEPRLPVHRRLAVTVRERDMPAEPFRRLIDANRLDQRVSRYETFDDLLRYCTLSADPVGRMVLGAIGQATPDRVILSDRVCTALQLVEHFQDVAEDFAAGRIYLPLEDLDTFGVSEADLAAPSASPALRNLMAFQVARASTILDQGAPLTSLLTGRVRLAIGAFVGGGRAGLRAVRDAGYDVLGGAPKASKQRIAGTALWVTARSFAPSTRAAARAAGELAPLCAPPPPRAVGEPSAVGVVAGATTSPVVGGPATGNLSRNVTAEARDTQDEEQQAGNRGEAR